MFVALTITQAYAAVKYALSLAHARPRQPSLSFSAGFRSVRSGAGGSASTWGVLPPSPRPWVEERTAGPGTQKNELAYHTRKAKLVNSRSYPQVIHRGRRRG